MAVAAQQLERLVVLLVVALSGAAGPCFVVVAGEVEEGDPLQVGGVEDGSGRRLKNML